MTAPVAPEAAALAQVNPSVVRKLAAVQVAGVVAIAIVEVPVKFGGHTQVHPPVGSWQMLKSSFAPATPTSMKDVVALFVSVMLK
jgi:hypothetical protein